MGEEKEKSRYAEVIVRITPARSLNYEESGTVPPSAADDRRVRSYDALIYSYLELLNLEIPAGFSLYETEEIRGFPLRGVEQVVVCWGAYREYRASFIRGEKAAHLKLWDSLSGRGAGGDHPLRELRSRLFGRPSPGLESLLSGELTAGRPLRIWWSSDTPDLIDLPWELLVYERSRRVGREFSFVRGVPPSVPTPRIPVAGPLKLALIDGGANAPAALHAALKDLTGVEVTWMDESPRSALQRAIREGFELVHIIADGAISHSYESVLYLSSPSRPRQRRLSPLLKRVLRLALSAAVSLRGVLGEKLLNWLNDYLFAELHIETCSAGELSALLNGSRVAVLSLTPPKTTDDDPSRLDGLLLPSIYGVFASLGNSPLPLPNIIAPLGPLTDEQTTQFWRKFYTRLAEPSSYSVEEAMEYAQGEELTVPVSLFLRQRLGREFALLTPERCAPAKEPTRINSELQAGRELIEQLHAIDSKYEELGDKLTDTDVITRETARQSRLEQELSAWTRLEEGE